MHGNKGNGRNNVAFRQLFKSRRADTFFFLFSNKKVAAEATLSAAQQLFQLQQQEFRSSQPPLSASGSWSFRTSNALKRHSRKLFMSITSGNLNKTSILEYFIIAGAG
ncbi:6569_t:CDS:2 [Ambispora gerdemannii]|uniref:6569_t:CDS:1 n=1 Tax=Ambispora gerdemannii TaxID=144530 RepID=A0A9N9FIJ9_9GLOM|nr:6569_t:CDS:2 [Ambispora gerdemannii]